MKISNTLVLTIVALEASENIVKFVEAEVSRRKVAEKFKLTNDRGQKSFTENLLVSREFPKLVYKQKLRTI